MRGKLIVIEGTDCSGKETQANLLKERLEKDNIKIFKTSFPMYDTPTGKIIGGPYLGKSYIGDGWFDEGASKVDPRVASLYYAADRLYNIPKILECLAKGYNVLLDRYVESNMAHQGGKIFEKEKRINMYKWLESLEYDLLRLPKPDLTIFLYMPYEYSLKLKNSRKETSDQHESSQEHLINAEKAYFELKDLYHFKLINCVKDNSIKTKKEISEEIYKEVRNLI